jgi:hypothetical protein
MKKLCGLLVFLFVFSLISLNTASAEGTGCMTGDLFNRLTGERCAAAPTVADCNSGDLFSSITGKPCTGNVVSWCHTFNTNLGIGTFSEEVSNLVEALAREGLMNKILTNEYDETIASAVSAFQEKYRGEILTPAGLTSPTGYVGARTRAKINSLYGCANTTTQVQQTVGSFSALSIDPSSVTGKVGVTVLAKALFNNCPPGAACFAGPQTVSAAWVSSNPEIVSVVNTPEPDCSNCGVSLPTASVKGLKVGSATITATYKNGSQTLTATAIATVLSSTATSSLKVLSPNGGETWTRGTTQTIKWEDKEVATCPAGAFCAPPAPKSYDIKLYAFYKPCTGEVCSQQYNAPTIVTLATGVSGSSREWTVPSCSSTYLCVSNDVPVYFRVEVCQNGTTRCDSSDGDFKIINQQVTTQGGIQVLSPNGGEVWKIGSTQTIIWQDGALATCSNCGAPAPQSYTIIMVQRCEGCATPLVFTLARALSASSSPASFSWKVGQSINTSGQVNNEIAPAGSYKAYVCKAGTDTCDPGDNYFEITN